MKKVIYTDKAPSPIGPYSQAILTGNTLYTSGQIALDAASMELVSGSISEETEKVMQNLEAVLAAAGMTFEHVVKTTIFLMDMGDFAAVNSTYSSYFNEQTAPARETVQVAGLPKNVRVEISMVAVK